MSLHCAISVSINRTDINERRTFARISNKNLFRLLISNLIHRIAAEKTLYSLSTLITSEEISLENICEEISKISSCSAILGKCELLILSAEEELAETLANCELLQIAKFEG